MASISELGTNDMTEQSTSPMFPVVIVDDGELRVVHGLGDFPFGVNFKIVLQSPFSFEDFAKLANQHADSEAGLAVAAFHKKNSRLGGYDEHDEC